MNDVTKHLVERNNELVGELANAKHALINAWTDAWLRAAPYDFTEKQAKERATEKYEKEIGTALSAIAEDR